MISDSRCLGNLIAEPIIVKQSIRVESNGLKNKKIGKGKKKRKK
jgi:hypothetical protein